VNDYWSTDPTILTITLTYKTPYPTKHYRYKEFLNHVAQDWRAKQRGTMDSNNHDNSVPPQKKPTRWSLTDPKEKFSGHFSQHKLGKKGNGAQAVKGLFCAKKMEQTNTLVRFALFHLMKDLH
jgi:hypothetical protein